MEYGLGVDLGTTSTVAAVRDGRSDSPRLVQLAGSSYSVPSVVAIGADGTLLAGEAAERRASTNPASAVREHKRWFGDPAPIVVDGKVFTGEALMAAQLADVIDRVERSEGARPARLALTHPAAWGPFRLEQLRSMAAGAGVDDVVLVAEPVAAAVANRDRLADGALVVVYDLGGGTFDAAVVRCGGAGGDWTIEGVPEGVERLGGADIDQAVMGHVDAVLGGQVFAVDSSDPDARAALLRLRAACREAKEQLSEDTDVEIPVELPDVRTRVRLTRAELEAMIRPRLADSLSVLDRVVASAGSSWDAIDAVLLVGGSSRIPAVGQMVQEHCGRPVVSATNPQLSVALGAARFAFDDPPAEVPSAAPAAEPITPPPAAAPPAVPSAPRRRGRLLAAIGGAVVVALAIGAFVVLGGGDGDTPAAEEIDETDVTDEPSDGDTAGAATTAPAATTPSTTPTVTSAAAPVDGDGGAAAVLAAAGLSATPCSATLPEGSIGGVATDGARVAFVLDRTLVTVADDPGCGFGAATPVALDVPVDHVTVTTDAVVVAGADGGAVVTSDGATVACTDLVGAVAASADGVTLAWDDTGRTRRFEITTSGCTLAEDDVYPDTAVTAAAFAAANTVVLGGVVTGDDATSVSRLARRRTEWTRPVPSAAADSVAACGASVCVLDSAAAVLHVFGTDGALLGSVDVTALAAAAGIADAITATAMAGAPDGSLIMAVTTASGPTSLLRATAERGG